MAYNQAYLCLLSAEVAYSVSNNPFLLERHELEDKHTVLVNLEPIIVTLQTCTASMKPELQKDDFWRSQKGELRALGSKGR